MRIHFMFLNYTVDKTLKLCVKTLYRNVVKVVFYFSGKNTIIWRYEFILKIKNLI